jgi:rRNA maturation endonuclease Nob1
MWKYRCDKCGCPQDYKHNFCPNCGAKMDLPNITDQTQAAIEAMGKKAHGGE